MENFVNLIERNRLPDMGKSWSPLIPYRLPKQLTPETLKTTVFKSDEIERICKFYGDGNDAREKELRNVVRALLEEIGFKRNMSVIRFLGNTLNKVLMQMTSGVYVNQYSIAQVKRELSQNRCPVLYLPSHRSYADFMLMSYICFAHDLEIPAIAAGMDFHAMVGMGSMLRNTGAFFMRRSFSSDDRMYWEVFREYVRTLITKYHSGVEFFLEGTRSRSGKALPAKIGLFSMLLEPFLKRKVFDILVVPVAVSYDRPVEEQLFAYELLGVPKPKESTSGLLKAFDIMDTSHGQMFVNFGLPMSLFDYFESNRSVYGSATEPNAQLMTKHRLQAIGTLARKIVDTQQELLVLTTFNLIAIYFNYRTMCNKSCNRDELKYGIALLMNFLKKCNALQSCEIASLKVSNMMDSLDIHSNILEFISTQDNAPLRLVAGPRIANTTNVDPNKLKGYALAANTMQRSLPAIILQIYANPCLYWLHQPAFYVLVRKMNIPKKDLTLEMQRMKQIFANEFVTRTDASIEAIENAIVIWDRLDVAGNAELSNLLLASIVPFVFCYFNIVDVIKSQLSQNDFTKKELCVKVQMHVENQLNANANYIHPYCLSLDSIANALHSFVAHNYLAKKTTLIKDKTVTNYRTNSIELNGLFSHLEQCCSMLQEFNGLANYSILSKM